MIKRFICWLYVIACAGGFGLSLAEYIVTHHWAFAVGMAGFGLALMERPRCGTNL